MHRTTRMSFSAVALVAALTLAGCAFTTTPEAETKPSEASTPSAGASAVPKATEKPEPVEAAAPTTLDELAQLFIDAGLIGEKNRGHLAVDGIATDGIAWDAGSSQDQYFELFYVDPATTDQAILDNVQLAQEEGYALYGDFPLTIDDVKGPFMVHYSAAGDPDMFKAVWEEATVGLE